MIKTKLSKENINKLNKFEQKFQQLNRIESDMYDRILKNQQHTMTQLQQAKQNRRRCLKQRPMQIRAQTFQEIIKHPANDVCVKNGGGNGDVWMYLANFVGDRHDLGSVEERMMERRRVREEIERVKKQEREREEERLRKEKEQREYEERIRSGKGFNNNKSLNKHSKKNSNSNKVPFNLQCQLHRRQVQQNRRRQQRIKQYKRNAYYQQNN